MCCFSVDVCVRNVECLVNDLWLESRQTVWEERDFTRHLICMAILYLNKQHVLYWVGAVSLKADKQKGRNIQILFEPHSKNNFGAKSQDDTAMLDDSFYYLTCLLSRKSRLKGVRTCSAGMSQLLWRHVTSIHAEGHNANCLMMKKQNSVHHFTESTLLAVDKLSRLHKIKQGHDVGATQSFCWLTSRPLIHHRLSEGADSVDQAQKAAQRTENIAQSNRDETQSYSESVCRHLVMMSV